MLEKQQLVKWLRDNKLLTLAERFKYRLDTLKTHKANRKFRSGMPDFLFPPADISYDAYGTTDYSHYYYTGLKAAESVYGILKPYLKDGSSVICEWGCGPARIIRHMPTIAGWRNFSFIGTDYNKKTIGWCQKNIVAVKFFLNDLTPPLTFADNSVDCVYCVSVFTHLSEEMHFAWLHEIMRVLRPGGIFMMTVHGDHSRAVQRKEERDLYDSGKLVVRGNVREGTRIFLAFHSASFMRNTFLKDLEIIMHEPKPDVSISGGQDIWVVRKQRL